MTSLRRRLIPIAVLAALGAAGIATTVLASRSESEAPVVRPALTVSVDTPRTVSMPLRFGADGSVAAWQEAIIGAEVAGLRLAEVNVNVGDVVRRGQVLATFEAETTRAELAQLTATVVEAEANALDAALNASRARDLASSGALSDQQITQFITAERATKARWAAQKAAMQAQRIRLGKTQVLAPDDGVISARNATVGAVPAGGQELFRLIRGSRLEWRAEVLSEEMVRLRPGTVAQLTAADGSRVEGRVRMVAPTVDSHTRSGLVYVDLPAAAGLKAGMFAKGEFVLGSSVALTVPQQAIVVRDGFSYVFRVGADKRVEQVRVTPGRRDADRVEIVNGLRPDYPLVARGAGFLNDGDLVSVAGPPAAAMLASSSH